MLNEVCLLGAELDVGESMRTYCPTCGRKEFSITRDDDGLLYQCFRASCSTAGRTGGRSLIRVRRKPTTVHRYEGAVQDMNDATSAVLADRVGFDSDHLIVAKARVAEDGRVAFPIIGPLGTRRGWVLRAYDGREPKALTRMDIEEPHTSWYTASRWERGQTVWLVEDIPSAVRAARYVDCIALCGTGCNDATVGEISAHYRNVVWALDADATTTALKQHRKWSLFFETSRVQVLERDFKDTEEEILCGLLTERHQ